MKRSKALAEIGYQIVLFMKEHNLSGPCINDIDILTDSILTNLENHGMIPPSYKIDNPKGYFLSKNEWEIE